MRGSMVDIQSAAPEIRRRKKEEAERKKQTTADKYNGLPYYRAAITKATKLAKMWAKGKEGIDDLYAND